MNDYADIVHKAATNPELLTDSDIATLRRLCREYPADSIAPALLLKYADAELSDEERAFARARVSLYNGHPATLITAIDPSGKGFDKFYPPAPVDNRPSTDNAIDLFLATYGHQSPEQDALLERMIFNPVPDYAEQLTRETPPPPELPRKDSQDSLIDNFLSTHAPEPEIQHKEPPRPRKKQPTAPTSSLLSESLAKIFIKQGRYERAYEIISNLSLNYPEKSIYFADQLRFLEKLIINQRHSK